MMVKESRRRVLVVLFVLVTVVWLSVLFGFEDGFKAVAAVDDDNLNLDDDGEGSEEFIVDDDLSSMMDDDDDQFSHAEGDEKSESTTETITPILQYTTPSTSGLHFAELFEDDWMDRWTKSTISKFSGKWERALRDAETIRGDFGLKMLEKAKHHAIAARFPRIETTKGRDLVVSYEAKFESGLSCGGGYLKIFDSKGMDMNSFDNETPYVIMFGPDKCGATNKVHVIIKTQNPKSKEWTEHHLTSPPLVPSGKDTHLYTLRILPDDTYEVLIDGASKSKGSMLTDFDPPFTPPKEIDDPNDSKPADWVDDVKINDPNAKKPDDWDEDAPMMISDEDATMPEGWLVDEPEEIVAEDSTKPIDWNSDDDGQWSPPLIKNPACSVGCGPWTRPKVKNPAYKGLWVAPQIDNPAYNGPWAPRRIPNPDYFENEHPHELSPIDAVGFELWTMDGGLLFDNIVVSQDWQATSKFIDVTFKIRQSLETSKTKKDSSKPSNLPENIPDGLMGSIYVMAKDHPIIAASTSVLSVISLFWILFRFLSLFKRGKVVEKGATSKKHDPPVVAASDVGISGGEDKAEETTKAEATNTRRRGGRPASAD